MGADSRDHVRTGGCSVVTDAAVGYQSFVSTNRGHCVCRERCPLSLGHSGIFGGREV